jgi:hypothetical protein
LIVLTIGPYSPVFAFDIIAKNRKPLMGTGTVVIMSAVWAMFFKEV